MSTLNDGRKLFATWHRKHDEQHLPSTASEMQRAMRRAEAARGDQLAQRALAAWEQTQHDDRDPAAD